MPSLSLRLQTDPDDMAWYATVEAELNAFVGAAELDGVAAMLLPSAVVEAINNIIKHAYRNQRGRPIDLHAGQDADALFVELRDLGGPMPLPLPSGDLPADGAESGRGWRIIRSVFPDVRYRRDGDENILTLVRHHPPSASMDGPDAATTDEQRETHR